MKEFIAQRCIHIISIFGERVKTRVRFTAYLNWKRDICCAMAYPSSVWKNCLLCTIKYASSAKKLTHYVTSRLRIKGMNNTWARLQKNNNSHDNCLCKSTNFTLCCERAYTVKLLYSVKKGQFPLIMLPTKTCNFNWIGEQHYHCMLTFPYTKILKLLEFIDRLLWVDRL